MATIINNRSSLETDPIRNFRFLVTFKPLAKGKGDQWLPTGGGATLGFTSVSGMSVTTDSIPYREGGYNTTVHQIPGQTTFAPISLQRGVILGTDQHWKWMRQLFATVEGGSGAVDIANNNFRCDLEVAVLSHPIAGSGGGGGTGTVGDDHVALRFNVYNAWPTSVAYSDLNAGDNAIFVEQVTLVHEGFDLNWAPSLSTSAATFGAAAAAPAVTSPNRQTPNVVLA
jgi:phage tail-like protein